MPGFQFLKIFVMILVIISLTLADKSTVERIRKHQEWLRQRNQQKTTTPRYRKSFELANLWRFDKQYSTNQEIDPSVNDVFPQNEVLETPTASAVSTSTALTRCGDGNTTTTTTMMTPFLKQANDITPTNTSIISTVLNSKTVSRAAAVRSFHSVPTTNSENDSVSISSNLPIRTATTTTISPLNSNTQMSKSSSTTTTTTTPTRLLSANVRGTTTTETLISAIFNENSFVASATPASLATTTTSPTTITTTPRRLETVTEAKRPKLRSYLRWSIWSKWSSCSRSCGGGVMYQQRKCISRNDLTGKRFISGDCIGVYRRYHFCNDEPCAKNIPDFRSEQCSAFNGVEFQGRKYTWEPYVKDDAECELNCKPLGMPYFATLNASVIDGTPCTKPAEYYRSHFKGRAICVGGICKAILANGAITGLFANTGLVPCGGLLCRPITGIFTRDPLPDDAYVHVVTIPAGASNISITELKNSINLLVLRTSDQKYIFNGDNNESESGVYEAAGTIFDYHRIDGLQHEREGVTEWITCTGPIRESLDLMIYSKANNPGLKYEYLLPIINESEENDLSMENDVLLKSAVEETPLSNIGSGSGIGGSGLGASTGTGTGAGGASRSKRRRKFNWKVVGFTTCSKSCGGGTQTPIIRCVRDNPMRYFSQRRCSHSEKPVLNENLLRCNTQPCPAYWRLDEWGECRCNQGDGWRHRDISCVQELASGIVIHVDNAACLEEEPPAKKACDCPKNRRRTHERYRTHTANATHARHRENAGIWLMSEWNNHCSVDCGNGVERRTIFCDRSKPNTERCDQRNTPEITRPCQNERSCENGDWFAGPWTPCNGNCFNLTRTRQVLCIQNQLIVDDEDCRPELRPLSLKQCPHEEVEYCAPRWHYSEWSECSKSCDGGTQRRSVKCLEYDERDNALRDSSKCRYSLREPIYRSCNTHKCDEPRIELLQNDVAASCVDDFSNCQWAVKAKLCSYEYYQENCCYSCGMSEN